MFDMLRTAVDMLKTEGLRYTLQFAVARIDEERYERRFGIRTHGYFPTSSLQIDDPDACFYLPTSYPGFFKAMRHVPTSGAFVDYGCGLGRVVVAAATLPFTRVTGVELSDRLVRGARENLARARGIRCRSVEVVHSDAARWHVPDDVTVFHFYNPFWGQTQQAVAADIARSLREAPRQAWIVFAYPQAMDPLMRSGQVIPLRWQRQGIDVRWPLHPVRESDPPLLTVYRVYALDSRRETAPRNA
jgi:SAM-dependent methyltransferase